LQGSTSGLGVVGYTMGGDFGWLGRRYRYGFAADSVKEAKVVTADGELVKASAHENADLFWGLKDGGGNFGIVTFALYPISHVFGGNLFYPVEKAEEVLELYARWSEALSDDVTSAVAFMNVPPMPDVPEPLRGRSVITVRFCYTGDDLQEKGEELLAPWRGLGETRIGEPIMDTLGALL
jgi:FAD/FMN-containing dehydrogenase